MTKSVLGPFGASSAALAEGRPGTQNHPAQFLAWPFEDQERADFYHRVRIFPREVVVWRKRLVNLTLENPNMFPAITRDATLSDVRARIDEGISAIREVARILAVVYGQPARVGEAVGRDVERVLLRLGIYRELGMGNGSKTKQSFRKRLPDLLPPNLRSQLTANLAIHAERACWERSPDCQKCCVRNFCSAFRRREAARMARSGAPTIVDLFAGAGGLSEGFARAGYRTVFALDRDATALRSYWLNHPSVPDERVHCRDIVDVRRGELRKMLRGDSVDVLAAAPPCQGFSHAGFRSKKTLTGYKVTADHRNFLYEPVVDLALELKPRIVLMENVPGMQSARRGGVSFLESAAHLLEIRGGFRTAIWQLNASAFGVPQDRIRYFLVACRGKDLPARPQEEYQDHRRTDFDTDALPPVTVDEAIFDLPARGAASGTAVEWCDRNRISSDMRCRRYLLKFGLLKPSPVLYNHTVRFHNARDLELYGVLRPGEDSVHAVERHGRGDLMKYRRDVFDDKYARLRGDRPSKTIVAHLAKDGNGYIHPKEVRSISVREGARLQSFHDEYAFCGSPSDQFVQLGNAVPPVLGEAIARSFLGVLKKGSSR